MCGIIAYSGKKNADKILLSGLRAMEYRGYDSAGIATFPKKGQVNHVRSVGEVKFLFEKARKYDTEGSIGIGHTRWATHGGVSEENTHPHYSHDGQIYLVHNGIIENFQELRNFLENEGIYLYGQTDTEILANLVAYYYVGERDLFLATQKALSHVYGAYGMAAIAKDAPNQIVAAKQGSPLLLGIADDGLLLASDVNAIIPHTREVVYLEDGEMLRIDDQDYGIYSLEGAVKESEVAHIEHDIGMVEKGDFEHFMLKEIYEQPAVIYNTTRGRVHSETGDITLGGLRDVFDDLLQKKRITIIACGTSYYAGLVWKSFLEELAGIEVDVEIASEFRYNKQFFTEDMAVIAISQSGETADTIAALKEAQKHGVLSLGIVNVPGSAIASMTDAGVYTHAGPEIGVASTKAFTAQITVLLMMALSIGDHKGLTVLEKKRYMQAFVDIPNKIQAVLEQKDQICKIAKELSAYHHAFFLGRHYQTPVAYEASLKFKEITYIHSEAYPAGELKHGPLALIDKHHPSILFAPDDGLFDKTISAYQEISARGGKVFTISDVEGSDIQLPKTEALLYPFISVTAAQMLAYYAAKELGREIDKPRNLAKSVTVE